MTPIDVRPADLATVRRILREHVPTLEVRAFGSRVAWHARETSDLDLALVTDRPLTVARMAALRAAFTDADLPFRVDIVDWASTSESFRKVVEAEYAVLDCNGRSATADWISLTLADACSAIDYGLTASASTQRSGPRFLRITDIVSGLIDWTSVPYVAVDDGTSEKYRLYSGDIVVARTGASTGASAYIKDPPRAVFASYLVRLQAKPDFSARFLAYFLKSEAFWQFIRGVLGDKSAQPNASASTMTAAPLRAPRNKADQRAIAHILGTLDDKIELNRRMNATLEAMARALFRSWFVEFDPVRAKMEGRDTGLPKDIADLFPDRLVDSELGEIPEGWTTWRLQGLAEHHAQSITPSSDPEVDFDLFSIPAYDAGQLPERVLGEAIRSNKAIVPPNAVLLSKLNPAIPRVWMPEKSGGRPQVCSTEFLVFTPRRPATRSLLFSVFTDVSFRDMLQSMATGTSGSHQRVPTNGLKLRNVLAGSRALVGAFGDLVTPVLARTIDARAESRTLAALRDALLPKLVSGELRGDRPGSASRPRRSAGIDPSASSLTEQ